MAEKLGVKRKHIYRLHRGEVVDHKFGRPAILLNGRITKSLVWTGTTKKDELNKEEPLILHLNNIPVYFYGNAIEVVLTKELKTDWINNETNQPYVLTTEQQDAVLKKFISFSKLKDPFLRINHLETSVEAKNIKYGREKYKNKKLKEEIEILKNTKKELQLENQNLKLTQEQLKVENQILIMKNEVLNNENSLLKTKKQDKTKSDYEYD